MKQAYDVIHPRLGNPKHLSPIIFLHGMCETRRSWKKVAPIIVQKTGRKAYALDARNHGESPRSDVMDYDVLTQDVVDFMNEHNVEKAIIVGHSMGGRTAINFALKHPGRIEALIVEDMTPKNVSSGLQSLVKMILDILYDYIKSLPPECDLNSAKKKLFDCILDVAVQFQIVKSLERVREQWDPDYIPIKKVGDSFDTVCNMDAAMSMLRNNALVQDLPEKNLTYDGDALFLYGDFTFYRIGSDRYIRKLFPRAFLKRIPDATHMIHLEFPDVFAELTSHFILHRNFQEAKL